MRLLSFALLAGTVVGLSGCSGGSSASQKEAIRTVAAGDKAMAGHLSYNVIDSQILTQLGEDASPRIPRERFLLLQLAVTNSSNVDNPIPAIELVSDSGQTYSELTDGTGVTNWFGLTRHVGPGQTERGEVAFDAPAAHYKVRFTDETTNTEVMSDLPLSYAHEKVNDVAIPTTEIPNLVAPANPKNAKTK